MCLYRRHSHIGIRYGVGPSLGPASGALAARIRQLTATDTQAALDALITPIVTAMGFELVRIQLVGQPGGKVLQVMAEDPATGQLTLDQCAAISRALDLPLDEADPIPGEYALEVSSPGIDRPLTRLSDWQRWQGHEAKLSLTTAIDGRVRAAGVIAGVDGDIITLMLKSGEVLALPFGAIAAAKLVLTDRLIAETRPLDTSGADEIIETETDQPANDD